MATDNNLELQKEIARVLSSMQTVEPGSDSYKAMSCEVQRLYDLALKNRELELNNQKEIKAYKFNIVSTLLGNAIHLITHKMWIDANTGWNIDAWLHEERGIADTSRYRSHQMFGPKIK